jgi:hypothetical protein
VRAVLITWQKGRWEQALEHKSERDQRQGERAYRRAEDEEEIRRRAECLSSITPQCSHRHAEDKEKIQRRPSARSR